MQINNNDLFTKAPVEKLSARIVQFPLVRAIIAILFLLPVTLLHNGALYLISFLPESVAVWVTQIETVVMFCFFIVAYRIYVKVIEKRQPVEVSTQKAVPETAIGILIGGGLMSAVILVLMISGCYRIESFNFSPQLIVMVITFFMAAFIEELTFRVILFRLVEEWTGSWIAIVTMALFFGFAHISNPNATVWSSIAITLEIGLLLAAAFMITRRLWLVWGIHIGWNLFQSGIWGVKTSGAEFEGIITSSLNGPDWLTGGEFGTEGSVVAVVVCVAAGTYAIWYAVSKGRIVLPSWKRKQISAVIEQPED